MNRPFTEYFVNPQNQASLDQYKDDISTTLQALLVALTTNQDAGAGANPIVLADIASKLANFSDEPHHLKNLLEQQLGLLVKHAVLVNQPHCAAHLHCPVTNASVAAELILSTLNQSMDSWDQAPLATHMEQAFIQWFGSKIGYDPQQTDGVFTSGGTQSNLTALLLARDTAMQRTQKQTYHVKEKGLVDDWRKYRVFCSDHAHFTIARSCAMLGLGYAAVQKVATSEQGHMQVDALEQALKRSIAQGEIPMAIVATAGTTDLGAIDPLQDIAKLAATYQIWLHIDAAYAGALVLTEYKSRLAGAELADSITIDFHKMFFQPISCSAILVKHKNLLAPLHFNADYLNRAQDTEPNLVEKSLSTTRRFDALKIWLSLKNLGLAGFNQMIKHLLELTQYVSQQIHAHQELELYLTPELTTVLFRYRDKGTEASDAFQQALRRKLLTTGKAVIAETRKNNQVYLKLTLLNPCATTADMDLLLQTIINQARQLV